MRETLNNILQYLKVGMWQTQREDVSPLLFVLLTVLRKLVLTIRFFTTRSIMDMASALTYSTLLAIVPILAVVFAIARGFGFSKYIEVWFREALSSQPQAADTYQERYLFRNRTYLYVIYGVAPDQQHRKSI